MTRQIITGHILLSNAALCLLPEWNERRALFWTKGQKDEMSRRQDDYFLPQIHKGERADIESG